MTGSYKEYPEYKESGVDWLGEVPNHWRLVPLRNVLEFRNEKNSPEKTSNILSLSIAKGVTEYSESEGKSGNKRKDDLTAYKLAYPNDIVMNSMNIIVGAVGISKYFGAISPVYYALYPKDKTALITYYGSIFHNAGFQRGLLKFGKGILIKQSDSGKLNTIRMKVSQDDLKTMYFPKPPIEEQQKIANFLDHETAKIDTLINKQEKLIVLLKEKRQAVISHAVTKGLNPDVTMKATDSNWVEEIPKHWSLGKLGYFAKVGNGATPARDNKEYWKNGSIGWLNSSKVNDEMIYEAEQFITPLALSQTSVKTVVPKDLVMAITGEGQTRGRVAICQVDATINQHLASIAVYDQQLHYAFLYQWLRSNYERIRYESSGAGATKGAITCGDISGYPIIIAPLKEQLAIVEYLKVQASKFINLIHKSELQVNLLKERKAALISAAVTGKIDVRNWQKSKFVN